MTNNTKVRKWTTPKKRATGYVDEIKCKVHKHGSKVGQELTPFEAGLRSGYLQCQSDHAGQYKYKNALDNGKSKTEAVKISRTIGNK